MKLKKVSTLSHYFILSMTSCLICNYAFANNQEDPCVSIAGKWEGTQYSSWDGTKNIHAQVDNYRELVRLTVTIDKLNKIIYLEGTCNSGRLAIVDSAYNFSYNGTMLADMIHLKSTTHPSYIEYSLHRVN